MESSLLPGDLAASFSTLILPQVRFFQALAWSQLAICGALPGPSLCSSLNCMPGRARAPPALGVGSVQLSPLGPPEAAFPPPAYGWEGLDPQVALAFLEPCVLSCVPSYLVSEPELSFRTDAVSQTCHSGWPRSHPLLLECCKPVARGAECLWGGGRAAGKP